MTALAAIRKAYVDILKLTPDDAVAVDFIYSLVASLYLPMETDPVWGFIVAPPASWKTEGVRPLFDSPYIFKMDEFSANALISGYVDPDDKDKDFSVLPQAVGKTILMKEFTTHIGQDEKRNRKIMATFRSAYDGSHRVGFGTGAKGVAGRFGILACVTGVIDEHLGDNQNLGERFLKIRIRRKRSHRLAATMQALDKSLDKEVWRAVLQEKADQTLEGVDTWMPERSQVLRADIQHDDRMHEWLSMLACVVTNARSLPSGRGLSDAEEGSRFAQEVQNIMIARATLDDRESLNKSDMRFAARIAYDTLPVEASKTLKTLYRNETGLTADQIHAHTHIPYERVLQICRQYCVSRVIQAVSKRFYKLEPEFLGWMKKTKIIGEAP